MGGIEAAGEARCVIKSPKRSEQLQCIDALLYGLNVMTGKGSAVGFVSFACLLVCQCGCRVDIDCVFGVYVFVLNIQNTYAFICVCVCVWCGGGWFDLLLCECWLMSGSFGCICEAANCHKLV
jgi:hypothetical protein